MHRYFLAAIPLLLVALGYVSPTDKGTKKAPAMPTYAADVDQIINKNCVGCHRPGEVAPFTLVGYDNSKKHDETIAAATGQRIMPPWKAVEGHGEFQNTKRLTVEEIATLANWAKTGATRGDAKLEPKAVLPPAG